MNENIIQLALSQINNKEPILEIKLVRGGSINDSYYVKTTNREYFIKTHPNAPHEFFQMEVKGLEKIRETHTIAVPEVYAYSDNIGEAFLLLEWVKGEENNDTEQRLGENIARLHQNYNDQHGFDHRSYTGLIPLNNGLYESWVDYYGNRRLKGQLDIGIENGRITNKRRDRLEKLMSNLKRFVPDQIKASYLHGDLWSGNWLPGEKGEPYVVDPSFLYGDRHFDLAFTELFGGFSKQFYEAYHEQYPIEQDYDDIKEIYQLYYLLVHLNIFGESYGESVDIILNKYIG
ncbi:fructosamine kinase family protein [Bacillaceae bacterium W0354]